MKDCLTYVIELPSNQESRRALVDGLRDLVERHGGEITASGQGDEMTVLDMIEQHEDFKTYIADDARRRASKLLSQI